MTTHEPPTLDWWYIRAYPGSSHGLEGAVRSLVPWVRARAGEADAARWFFMRYLDMTGQHLRLRIQAPPAALDRLHGRIDEVEDLLQALPEPVGGPRLLVGADLGELPGRRMVRPAVFAPEIKKYGGPVGAEIALELFQRCSVWFDDHEIIDLAQSGERAALAIAYQRRLVSTALPENGDQIEFWTRHRKQWGWQLRMLLPSREEYTAHAQDVVSRLESTVPPSRTRDALDDLVGGVVEALDRTGHGYSTRTRIELLIEYLHMDMNRWGLMPAEECLLGLLAQSGHQEVDHRTNHRWKDAS